MKYVKDTVSSQAKGELGSYQCPLFESIDEARKYLGDDAALGLLNKAWKVLIQSVARRAFLRGAKPEEVSKLVKEYKPGQQKTSLRSRAMDAIVNNASKLAKDPALKEKVQAAVGKGQWKEVLTLLGEQV